MNRPHKQSLSELKLRRNMEQNLRLREDLARPRIRVSEASARCVKACVLFLMSVAADEMRSDSSLIRYCKNTKDHLVSFVAFVGISSD